MKSKNLHQMKNTIYLAIFMALFISSCTNHEDANDASGVFEAIEVIVSSESNGKIIQFQISEGEEVAKNQEIGMIDSTQLHLSKLLLLANKEAILSGKPDVKSQVDATQKEIDRLLQDKKRIEKLLAGDVATQKQLDDVNAQINILNARLIAQKKSLHTSVDAINQNSHVVDAQIAQIKDQMSKCKISSPIDGVVLVKYAEEGELTGIGKPLFKVADLSEMILRAYITADQLEYITLGQEVEVSAEYGQEGIKKYQGIVNWISGKAEFTPKTIQTQDERANLVYAVKIRVPNDGFIKIGMYGGVNFIGE